MKIILKYNKKLPAFNIKTNKYLFISFPINRSFVNKNSLINISLITYNYMLVLKILRQFGLVKPLLNRKNY